MSEIEAPASWVLRKVSVSEGSVVPVGNPIAIITEPGEELPPIEETQKPLSPSAAEKK